MGEESGKSRSPQSEGRSYSAEAVPETKGAEHGDLIKVVSSSETGVAAGRLTERPTDMRAVSVASTGWTIRDHEGDGGSQNLVGMEYQRRIGRATHGQARHGNDGVFRRAFGVRRRTEVRLP